MNQEMQYNFPEIKAHTLLMQVLKIKEEAAEVEDAYIEGRLSVPTNANYHEHLIEETLDTIQACETLLRQFDSSLVDKKRRQVIQKNKDRGYYERRLR